MISFSEDSKRGIFVISFFQIVSSILPVKVTGALHFACKEDRNFPPKDEILPPNNLVILKQQGVNKEEIKNSDMCFKWVNCIAYNFCIVFCVISSRSGVCFNTIWSALRLPVFCFDN